jgi:hypothetical protein
MIGPFPTNVYNQADGAVWFTFNQVATVTCAAIKAGG